MQAQRGLQRDDWLWLLGSLCALHRLPFDAGLTSQQHPPPCTLDSLTEAARALGLRLGLMERLPGDWSEVTFPCAAFVRDADSAPDSAPRPFLLARCDGERLLGFPAGSDVPELIPVADAARRFEPRLLLAARAEAALPADDGAEPPAGRPFGFRWFLDELLRHKAVCRDVLAASLTLQVVGLATPLCTQVIIDKVVVHQTTSTLAVVASALVLFLVFGGLLSWLRQTLVLHTGTRIDAILGDRAFRHLLRLPMPFFDARPTGTLVARLHGVETIREFVSGAAVALALDLPFLFVFLAVMFFYSWQLSLLALAFLLALAVSALLVTPLFRARVNRQFLLGARTQALATEYVSGMATVKSLQMEPVVESRYGDALAAALAAAYDTRRLGAGYGVAAQSLEQAMSLSLLTAGALLVMRGDGFTVGMLVAFQMFAARLSQPLMRLAGLWTEFQQASIAVARLGDVLDTPQEPHSLAPRRAGDGPGVLEMQGVGFRYGPDRPWVLRGLDARIAPGRLTLVTGPSGCGKSTLTRLLLGFHRAEEGRILLDGKDLRHLCANELRRHFGVVPQETVLFSGSIQDNLLLADPHASFGDAVTACRAAEIHDFIETLPEGYRSEIGERGSGLSGGQRQRIAIARALLRRPAILVFDEATSNLDAETAEAFARTVNRLRGRATMIFIAHQVPRGLQVDEVLRLGGAPAAPSGTAGLSTRLQATGVVLDGGAGNGAD